MTGFIMVFILIMISRMVLILVINLGMIMMTIFYHSLHSGSDPGEDHDNYDNHIHHTLHTGYDPWDDYNDHGDNDHHDDQVNLDG